MYMKRVVAVRTPAVGRIVLNETSAATLFAGAVTSDYLILHGHDWLEGGHTHGKRSNALRCDFGSADF